MPTLKTSQVRLEHVSLVASIDLHYLLKDVSFEVLPGDRIALVGASGAGKTSLLQPVQQPQQPTESCSDSGKSS